jgi:hypothetical protein
MNRTFVISAALFATATAILIAPRGGVHAQAAQDGTSPLAAYLGFGYNADEEDKVYDSEEAKRQAYIRECMQDAGFEYWPRPADIVISPGDVAPDTSVPVDRNIAYRASLSDDQAAAYYLALEGRVAPNDGLSADEMALFDADGDGRISWDERADMGCLNQAEHALPGVFYVDIALRDPLNELESDIERDERVVEARQGWVECIHAAGYSGGDTYSELYASVISAAEADPDMAQAAEDAITSCDGPVNGVLTAVRVEKETAFYAAYEEQIQKLAYPASE